MRARQAITIVSFAAAGVAGCGGQAPRPHSSSTAASASSTTATLAARPAATPKLKPPPVLRLALQLPLIGLSSAPSIRYATTAAKPTVRGVVSPASATVYMRAADGTRIALNPRADGRFAVRTKLSPGTNTLQFTAARLGSQTRHAELAITWRGSAAAARQRAIYADPAKYLPAASAGINRKLKGVGKPAPVPAAPSPHVTISFSLHTIKAPPPPAVGGDGKWLGGFELTEYYPALESWFTGRPVSAPGLSGSHRIDWLYSARGLSMEGDGIGLDGRQYHIDNVGSGGWLTATGGNGAKFGVGADAPFWRTGGFWRNDSGQLTFPLANGNWSNGVGLRYVQPPAGISFAPGPSRPLSYLRSVAVDPRTIPEGSHIYIPAYASVNGGWFQADDTGGAIVGRHIDIFRPPPANPADQGNFATGQRVYIVAPGQPLP